MKITKKICNQIYLGIMVVEGLCLSITVDECLKQTKCNKHIKNIGRIAASTAISIGWLSYIIKSINAINELYSDENGMDIEYPSSDDADVKEDSYDDEEDDDARM